MELPGAFDRLGDERVWVAWADEGGRKVPKSPHGGNARSNDPSTWGTYAEAEAVRARNGYSGVGLMLTDGYTGIDLDGVVEDGKIADWAQEIVDELGSYAEISPSGTGLHILGWSDVERTGPIGRNNRSGVEVYNHGRYFTVTGNVVRDAPLVDVTPDLPALIERHFSGESPEQVMRRRIGDLARDQVKRRANRTMAENCARDGVRYARVPRGSETCGFCIMLASRGFVYRSEKSAGALDHYHANCDCRIVASFDADTVEGYDPDDLYLRWKDPEGWEEKHRNASGRPSQPPSFSHTVEDVDLPSGRSGVSAGTSQCNIYETQDGKRFIFPVGMDTSKQDMTPERAVGLYERVPDNVKRHMQDTIFFVDYENPEDAYWRRKYKNFSRSYATGGDEITFYAHTGHDDDYVVRTFCHEAGHYIDSSNSKGGKNFSSRFDWQDAMASDYSQMGNSHPTSYASNSNSEDFAESVAEYSINGVQFRRDFPSRASLLDSLLT